MPEVQHAPEQGSNIQNSMIEDTHGKIIDLGESIAVSPVEGTGQDETKEEKKTIPLDFFYPEDHVESKLEDSPITGLVAPLYESFGFDSYKRFNI